MDACTDDDWGSSLRNVSILVFNRQDPEAVVRLCRSTGIENNTGGLQVTSQKEIENIFKGFEV